MKPFVSLFEHSFGWSLIPRAARKLRYIVCKLSQRFATKPINPAVKNLTIQRVGIVPHHPPQIKQKAWCKPSLLLFQCPLTAPHQIPATPPPHRLCQPWLRHAGLSGLCHPLPAVLPSAPAGRAGFPGCH